MTLNLITAAAFAVVIKLKIKKPPKTTFLIILKLLIKINYTLIEINQIKVKIIYNLRNIF